jgi:hypothetical protein
MRFTLPLTIGLCALAVTACGGGSKPEPAPGSPENPLTAARPDEKAQASGSGALAGEPSAAAGKPGYKALLERQNAKPQHRFTPCNLVTETEARAIVGEPMRVPIEAPQGPTCIYRPRKGEQLIALAIQELRFATLKRQMRDMRQVAVSDRTAYCGTYGQPVLYVPLSDGRVLSVSADCNVARGFAAKALHHL